MPKFIKVPILISKEEVSEDLAKFYDIEDEFKDAILRTDRIESFHEVKEFVNIIMFSGDVYSTNKSLEELYEML